MADPKKTCPECASDSHGPAWSRRDFLAVGAAAVAATRLPAFARADDKPAAKAPETAVKALYETLSDEQKKHICHAWDFQDPDRGHLRSFVSNNWHINKIAIASDFYTADQQALIRDIFAGCYHPDWLPQIDQQLKDDAGGYGKQQNIAIFGQPGQDKFELVMTGRHLTLRCDGNSTENVAFGGPIFYGHAARGFNEAADHPGNVFWPQALEANKVFTMLDGKQREKALSAKRPGEADVNFRADGMFPGLPVAEMSGDQKAQVEKTLAKLVEPYRVTDRDEVHECLKANGGLDKCSLAFYKDGESDIGNDGVWDCWRLEGPAFVWYFRGQPHVHVWVNVAANPSVKINALG